MTQSLQNPDNLVDKNTNLPRYHCFELLYRQNTSAVVQSDAMEKDCGEQLAMYECKKMEASVLRDH